MSSAPSAVPPAAPAWRGVDPSRRQLLFGGAMLATAGIATWAVPRNRSDMVPRGSLERGIPKQIGRWSLRPASDFVLPPSDELSTRIYDDLLTRTYVSPSGQSIMLLIAYGGGQTGIFQVHRPEACYPANGLKVSPKRSVEVPVGGNRTIGSGFMTATGYQRIEQLLYWTRVGDFFPESWAAEHVAVVRSNLVGHLPDGVLVRLSILSDDVEGSLATLEGFAMELVTTASRLGRRIILGPTA